MQLALSSTGLAKSCSSRAGQGMLEVRRPAGPAEGEPRALARPGGATMEGPGSVSYTHLRAHETSAHL
eukprot:5492504-Alexandrium_andersonii.AAC.1